MSNLRQIKTKIKSIENIKKITRALEIVSTIKLQKNKDHAQSLKDYLVDLLFVLNSINDKVNAFDEKQKVNSWKDLTIFVSTDRWLCGSLNSKLFRKVFDEFEDKKDDTDFFVVWTKAIESLQRNSFNVVWNIWLKDEFKDEDLLPLYEYINSSINQGSYENIYIYFNYFKSSLVQQPTRLKVFPLEKSSFDDFIEQTWIDTQLKDNIGSKDLVVDTEVETLKQEINRQIRNYIINSVLVQNKTWEHASRMIAMKNANDSCGSMIRDLNLTANKIRQGAITQEISEIVGAKAAIEG